MTEPDKLCGVLDLQDIEGMSEDKWRKVQFTMLTQLDGRVSKVEKRVGWQNFLSAVPWAALLAILIKFLSASPAAVAAIGS